MPLGNRSTLSRYCGNVSHDHLIPACIASGEISSARSRFRITSSLSFSAHGASENPQLPITTEVTPCQHEHVPSASQKTCASICVCASTSPGATICPSASIVSRALSRIFPIAAILSPSIATSALKRGMPLPSTIVPLRIIRSYMATPFAGSRQRRANGRRQFRGRSVRAFHISAYHHLGSVSKRKGGGQFGAIGAKTVVLRCFKFILDERISLLIVGIRLAPPPVGVTR